jgi:hypothetical protein
MDEAFRNEMLRSVTYDAVRKAMGGDPFTMRLPGEGDIDAITAAVNQGIDAHLEACYIPDRGDSYEFEGGALVCSVSPESMPVLLRRLFEDGSDDATSLASSFMTSLGFRDSGEFVGREALGLE